MFSNRQCSGATCLALLLAAQLGCGGSSSQSPQTAGVDRVLITHTENLSGNAALDGAARVISHLVRAQLTGNRAVAVFEAAQETEAVQRRAGRIVRSWLDAGGGKLRLHVTVRSAEGKTLEQWQTASSESEGPAVLAEALARHLSPTANRAAVAPAEAAALFGQALNAPAEDAIPLLQKTVAQAGTWGDAYYLLGANLAATGKKDEAQRVWKEGAARSSDAVSKARMEIGLATAANEQAAAVEANEKLAELLPSEPEHGMQAGAMRLARGEFAKASALMAKAVAVEPGVGEWWNQLAFVQAFAGEDAAALRSLQRYERMAPRSGNPADSRGEIQFLLGRFQEASASFDEAFGREPNFLSGATLFKSAQSRLLAGDAAGAEKEFQRYASGPLKNHPLRELMLARWEYQIGKKAQALNHASSLAAAGGTAPDLASACWSQIAFWRLLEGDRAKALEAAKIALQKSLSMPAKREALMAYYFSQPSGTVEEWRRRANGNPPPDLLALALVLDRKWKDALPVLAELVAKTHPFRAGHWRVLYGWALLETGAPEKAREWLRWYPIPLSSGGETIEPLVMEKMQELRARAFARKG